MEGWLSGSNNSGNYSTGCYIEINMAERWLSGLRHSLGERAGEQSSREFKSHSLRHV